MDGTVGNRSARPGSYATIGAQLMSLVPARGLWVDANFKESQLARMHAGQPVFVEADVLSGQVFHGHVASLAPATGAVFSVLPAENATGNFTKIVQRVPVRILLDGDASALGQLRPGLSVVAKVDMRTSEYAPERADVASARAASSGTNASTTGQHSVTPQVTSIAAPARASSPGTTASVAGQRSVAPRATSTAAPARALPPDTSASIAGQRSVTPQATSTAVPARASSPSTGASTAGQRSIAPQATSLATPVPVRPSVAVADATN
jgi:hypothetical protein